MNNLKKGIALPKDAGEHQYASGHLVQGTRLRAARIALVVLWLSSVVWPGQSAGESTAPPSPKLPLYEYGLVAMGARIPHYAGSDEYETYGFPLPYFIYRGEILKADNEGVRTIFWRNKHFETDISLSGNPPVGDNKARTGMAELNTIFEVGPALNYYFFEYGDRDSFFLQANFRATFSIDVDGGLAVEHEGYVSEIFLLYQDSRMFSQERIRFHLSTGMQFGDAGMHDYFYSVGPRDAKPDREQYNAQGGYSGLQVSGSITKELTPAYQISCYGQWTNVAGAVFEDSPLVRTTNNYLIGAMFVWKIGESETLQK